MDDHTKMLNILQAFAPFDLIQKQNEAACVSVALHERHSPTPWDHRPELKTRFCSQTGEKREDWSHWIYSGNDFIALTSKEPASQNAKHIVHAVNILPELIATLNNLLEALSEVDTCNNSTKTTEALGLAETKANDVLRRAMSIS